MSAGLRSGNRAATAQHSDPPSPPSARSRPSRRVTSEEPAPSPDVHRGVKGDRYLIPQSEFGDDGEDERLRYAVVREHGNRYVSMWFDGDTKPTVYRDRLEDWSKFYVPPNEYASENEDTFQEVERQAGMRMSAGVPRRRRAQRVLDAEEDNDEGDTDYEDGGGGNGVEEPGSDSESDIVDEWESDAQDDENEMAPNDVEREPHRTNNAVDAALENMHWEDCGRIRVDPRVASGANPQDITPVCISDVRKYI